MSTLKTMQRRRAAAFSLVVGLFLALGLSQGIQQVRDDSIRQNPGLMIEQEDSRTWRNVDERAVSAMLDRAEAGLEKWDDCLPDDFAEEIGVLPEASDLRVFAYGQGCVVGYSLVGEAQDVQYRLEESLRQRGWLISPLGGITGATFLKANGRYTWALATCTQVGMRVSVVVRGVGQGGDIS